jgi:uncharacterized protein YajQ (UPF0234 family)
LFPETPENQENQNQEKKKVYQFIRLEKIKVRRNLRDQCSRDTGQHEDDNNPQDSRKVIMEEILQNRDYPPMWAE